MLKIFHSRVCRQPPTQHLYSELVPEGTFQKQQACPAQTTQRHGSSMQSHFCHGQPLPETPPASAVTREGPAWQVRAAGQGAPPPRIQAFSHAGLPRNRGGPRDLLAQPGWPKSHPRRPLLQSFHGLLSQLSDRSPASWAGAGPGTAVTLAPVTVPTQEPSGVTGWGGLGSKYCPPTPIMAVSHTRVPTPEATTPPPNQNEDVACCL